MNPKVSELLNDVHKGSLVVPDFQRSFVWEPEAVRELLVSVLGNYFIGSILILQQFKEDSMFALRMIEGANDVNPSAQIQPFVKVLLDGQQRITALYYAIYVPNIPMKNRGSAYRFYLDLNEAIKGEWDNAVKAVNIKDKKGMNEISKKVRAIASSILLCGTV